MKQETFERRDAGHVLLEDQFRVCSVHFPKQKNEYCASLKTVLAHLPPSVPLREHLLSALKSYPRAIVDSHQMMA